MFHIQSLRVKSGKIVPLSWNRGATYTVLPGGEVLVTGSDSWDAPDPWGDISDSDVDDPASEVTHQDPPYEGTQRPKRRVDNETSREGRTALRWTTTGTLTSSAKSASNADPAVETGVSSSTGRVAHEASSPVIFLSKSETHLSCVNDDCRSFLQPLSSNEQITIWLQPLNPGLCWVILTLNTTASTEWSLLVQWSVDSVFPRNVLCVRHGIIRGARFGHFMHLPLRHVDPCQQTRNLTTFLPLTHWRRPLERDVAIGERIARSAGLEEGAITGFLNFWDLRTVDLFPRWLINDLCGGQHPDHIPGVVAAKWNHDVDDEDADTVPLRQSPPCMAVSTLWCDADMPRIRCSFPGRGTPARADVLTGLPLPRLRANGWVVRTTGHVDTQATRIFLTRNFAGEIGLRVQDIDTSLSGSVFEVRKRPGGPTQLSYRGHRGNYHGLGRIVRVPMLLSHPGQQDRCVLVDFVIIEDGVVGTLIDFVLDPSFARSLREWVHDAMCADPVSQSFARGLYKQPHHVVFVPEPSEDSATTSFHDADNSGTFDSAPPDALALEVAPLSSESVVLITEPSLDPFCLVKCEYG